MIMTVRGARTIKAPHLSPSSRQRWSQRWGQQPAVPQRCGDTEHTGLHNAAVWHPLGRSTRKANPPAERGNNRYRHGRKGKKTHTGTETGFSWLPVLVLPFSAQYSFVFSWRCLLQSVPHTCKTLNYYHTVHGQNAVFPH